MALTVRMKAISVIGVIISCIVFTVFSVPVGRQALCALPQRNAPVTMQRHRDRKLHLLLPIDSGAAKTHQRGFCKTLLSLLVHGYDPIIINWDVASTFLQMQRLKITGTPYLFHLFVCVFKDPHA